MSYYATLDNAAQTGGDVATTSGWADFSRWVDSLDADVPELKHLTAFGWSQELDDLETDLRAAIKEGGDDDSVDVASGLLKMLDAKQDAEVITITDGSGAELS